MSTSFKMRASRTDAIAVLKADHRHVERLFKVFDQAADAAGRRALGLEICTALKVHSAVEQELFYPVFLQTTGNVEMHHEAVVEHDGATRLIMEIEQSAPGDAYFEARVNVLCDMIRHHFKEEEKPDGLFATIRRSDADLEALGRQLQVRKRQLTGESPPSASRAA